ncbi:probable LRR receptor-like serine/threonine-protein kinase At5g45780 isoform X1 [Amborella trichopoda]|uniref:probable LRR receptor-like serine/threonine-protein kinase At5g45780 isoform X1 n=2 Tax=Amborella trichopoda TaxID=13333 RepID=UPI0009C02CC2|nr:probable LRR receptor-like serine/threonine-protein kinase At5g45780 isoform X1 [Amborella trichopoda]|eukprot:XP_011620472.2 probable LRR receptor-like serine/threonine-protein kinase At5g45780 isoform X1 [Amborella trichopoda]
MVENSAAVAVRLLLFCAFPLVIHGMDPLLSPKGVNYEVAALMGVKSGMKDEFHVFEGWDINSVDPCTWAMIGCSPEGFVIALEMPSKSLSGYLSPIIGNLSQLQTLLLQDNNLAGPIPVELGRLTKLQTLDLSVNQFVGEIPSSLGFLMNLNYLRLTKNGLSGPIPALVANLSGIIFLDLSFNNLSGPAPRIRAKDYSVAGNGFLCASSFLKGCIDTPKPIMQAEPSRHPYDHRAVIAIAVSLGCISALLVFFLVFLYWQHASKRHIHFASYEKHECEVDIANLKRFSYRELQIATDNFNPRRILGQGGFGVVYKGFLQNGAVVAVKRLKDPSFTGEVQFQTEVETISLALHRNLLRLYGFCMTSNERLLVYPYMSNGSVADRLRDNLCDKPALDWEKRVRIAIGAARGLLYLHEQCNPKIIHRDVKAANILLDDSFEAVVGDFGLAKLLDRRDSHVTTAVRGTVGHIAPEYLSTGQSSEKTDVFGFGVLLLELITGQKAMGADRSLNHKGILDWVRSAFEEKRLDQMVDKDLSGYFDGSEIECMVMVALLCTQSNPNLRPKMSEVVKMLEGGPGATEHLERPDISYERCHSFSRTGADVLDGSSSIIEAMELSGPR